MNSNTLVVPMVLHALAVDPIVEQYQANRRFKRDYKQLDQFLTAEPEAFSGKIQSLEQGIYLHWILPDYFLKPSEDKEESAYPVVPNRWVILRLSGPTNQRKLRSWIVESDRLHSPTGSPYRVEQGRYIRSTTIGKVVNGIDAWSETDSNKALFLTAMGSGDLTFSTYQPSCENVFSIVDKLDDLTEDELELDYIVLGWFSNPKYDPLFGVQSIQEFEAKLRSYDWSVLDPNALFADQIVLKGQIQKVTWSRNGNPAYRHAVHHPNRNLVIAETSVDAISELLGSFKYDIPQKEESIDHIVEALQYDLLRSFEEPGEEERLEHQIHRNSFHSSPGGTLWELVDPEDSTASSICPTGCVQEEDALLAALNDSQQRYDSEVRKYSSFLQMLYEVWWKWNREIIPEDILVDYISESNELSRRVAILRGECLANKKGLEQVLREHRSKRIIKKLEMPRFWAPQDPVVMITGFQKASHQFMVGLLECSIFEYDIDAEPSWPAIDLSKLPLHVASLLVDRLNDTTLTDVWRQPWLPLFLEWEVEWEQVPYTGDHWTFDGYDRSMKNGTVASTQRLKGRTILSPHAIFSLKSRFQDYAKQHPNEKITEDVVKFIEKLDHWDVLSQTLGGFHLQLLQRDDRIHPVPSFGEIDDVIDQILGSEFRSMPVPSAATHPDEITFQPIRAGKLRIIRLEVMDGFGQLDVVPLGQRHMIAESVRPLASSGSEVELKPRLVQGARLNFQMVAAEPEQDEHSEQYANPVCGWVIPNHMNRGLSIYDPDGSPLGHLRLWEDLQGKKIVKWEDAPKIKSSLALSNIHTHLNRAIRGMVAAGGDEFATFLKVIDDTLWIIDPKGHETDQVLAAFMGRPLVLVRAKLSLELEGLPVYSAGSIYPRDRNENYLKHKYEIKLGNLHLKQDGVLGYFLGDRYNRFYSVYEPNNHQSNFVQQIGTKRSEHENAHYIRLSFQESHNEAYITLLMDPFAVAHATSGILPVKDIALMEKFRTKALQNMEVYFSTGPLLTVQIVEESNGTSLLLPVPNSNKTKWSWIERSRDEPDKWLEYAIKEQDEKDPPTRDTPSIREGMYKLKLK
ncbi:hypothetical protein ACE3NQ_24955 [Paenibacillus terreus]|uniref:Uncharacterized protein n=1 Tax=Paenibacillus terreus TaxID=1387834 RepID=A0ABV5BEN0_9BACL